MTALPPIAPCKTSHETRPTYEPKKKIHTNGHPPSQQALLEIFRSSSPNLNLSGMFYVPNTALGRIFLEREGLQSVNLTSCVAVNDRTVEILVRNHPHLQTLILADCPITDRGLSALHSCTHLQEIDISGCRVTALAIERLQAACSTLRVITTYPLPSQPSPQKASRDHHLPALGSPNRSRIQREQMVEIARV